MVIFELLSQIVELLVEELVIDREPVDLLLLDLAKLFGLCTLLNLRLKLLLQLTCMPSLPLLLELKLYFQLGDLRLTYLLGLRGLYLEDLKLLL